MGQVKISREEVRAFCKAAYAAWRPFRDVLFEADTFRYCSDPKAHPLGGNADVEMERRVLVQNLVEAGLAAALAERETQARSRRKPRPERPPADDLPEDWRYAAAQEVRLRHTPGADHGSRALVLAYKAKDPDCRLLWTLPGKHWSGIGCGQSYDPATLRLMHSRKQMQARGHNWSDSIGDILQEGGRLSQKLIAEHTDKIAKHFGVPSIKPHWIDPKRTLVIP